MSLTSRSDVDTSSLDGPSLGAVWGALADAAGEMKAIAKDQRNQQQQFDFRSIETIVGHAKPILAAHGLAVTPAGYELISQEEVKSGGGTRGFRVVVYGRWLISHTDGSYVVAAMLGEAIDYGDKATSKAVQMAYKYMLTQMLGIGSEDPDGLSPAPVSDEEVARRRTNALKAKAGELFGDDALEIWTLVMTEMKIEGDGSIVPSDKLEAVEARLKVIADEYEAKNATA